MNRLNLFLHTIFRSITHARHGLRILFREEQNARIHLVFAIVAIVLGWILGLTSMEWILIVLVIGFVFALELMNTSIEQIADFVSPEWSEKIKKIKDLAAAGVWIGAMSAFIIGLILFIPKLLYFLKLSI